MIKGTGIDIIEIERISKAVKNQRFVKRIFTKNEIVYFKSINNNIYTIAGNFAAKEAVVKTFGTGIRGFKWTDVEIIRDKLGKPMVILYGKAKEIAEEKGISNIELSISHCRQYAVAQAIGIEDNREIQ
ncbi:holo-ACP synthase [Paramaledivibacter caminithermalis]|uniref:Holo-[acyl-carrier-protein] synthase n=1 Tax=Paramaledivibacter caminithermalis (strain DSM 15212 / CIP 107654 / DViRD3) TaxID=1121301 RepID=A0A1M6KRX0_PARC5|nr:holo-ACP synthase [Paramaledivibacter caminithermalis]SHJ61661.1 holo-[acyl-carrier-protein] synthase [Paramaledivibacter caminithermalis DSM 15212]